MSNQPDGFGEASSFFDTAGSTPVVAGQDPIRSEGPPTFTNLNVPPPKPTQGFAVYQHFYPLPLVSGEMVLTDGNVAPPSPELLQRIIGSYRREMEQAQDASGIWTTITGHKQAFHDTLMAGDAAQLSTYLTDPALSMMLHGFDQPTINAHKNLLQQPTLVHHRTMTIGSLRRAAEAMGAIPMAYPEGYGQANDVISNEVMDADELIAAIEAEVGIELVFPGVFLNEIGVATKRGVVTYRAAQSLYQGWRLATLAKQASLEGEPLSALEIGGGTGRTAFFANLFGVSDYSIVDLPLTGVVQSYFLASALGEDRVVMPFEVPRDDAVKVLSPPRLADRPYTAVASFDALVEFSKEAAADYVDHAVRNARVFCSINRESKSYRVRDLLQERKLKATRHPYWLRQGYAEEVVQLKPPVTSAEQQKIAEVRSRHARMLTNIHHGVEVNAEGWGIPMLTARAADEPDVAIAERLAAAFYKAAGDRSFNGDGLWDFMHKSYHREIGAALQARDMPALAGILAGFFFKPVSTGLCQRNPDDRLASVDPLARMQTVDAIASLGLALGVLRQSNPASGNPPNLLRLDPIPTLEKIEAKLNWSLLPPNCGGIAGLAYRDGVIPLKQLYQLYAAHRLRQINGGPLDSCLEIGGGVGLLAHVCARNDVVRELTVIDLPMVNMLQGYFMLKSSVADRVVLHGEPVKTDGGKMIRILPDSAIGTLPDKSFDMAVNQDSLPEMANDTARDYLRSCTRLVRGHVLSINHESAAPWGADFEHGVVNELAENVTGLHRTGRFPYWMRGGYVEEIFAVTS